MKQTAVQWLVEQFDTTINYTLEEYQLKIEKAKAMEKEQIFEAYRNGRSDQQSARLGKFYNRMSEQYYTETYESNT